MKLLCFVLFVVGVKEIIAAPSTPHTMSMIKIFNKCKKAESLPSSDLSLLVKHQLPVTQEGKCFIGCLFEQLEIFAGGAFNADKAQSFYATAFTNHPEVTRICQTAHDTCDKADMYTSKDKCVYGVAYLDCLDKALPDIEVIISMYEG